MEDFVREGCGCELLRGSPCYRQFSTSHYQEMRNYCAQLDHDALDLAVMGQIMAFTSTSEETKRRKTERKKCTVIFHHLSQKVKYHIIQMKTTFIPCFTIRYARRHSSSYTRWGKVASML